MDNPQIELIARGVLVRENRLLICRNVKNQRSFLPGGHVEYNESGAQALAREMQEEAAVTVEVGDYLGTFEASFHQSRGDKPSKHHHEINLIYRMDLDQSIQIKSIETKIEFAWIELAELEKGDSLAPAGIISVVRGDIWFGSAMSE